jgi:hypothetical protein
VLACSLLALRARPSEMAAAAPQCQLLTGSGEVSPEFDAFVKDTGLAGWGLDYQARRPSAAAHARG